MSRRASQTRHEPDKNAVLEISAKDKQGAELIFAPKKNCWLVVESGEPSAESPIRARVAFRGQWLQTALRPGLESLVLPEGLQELELHCAESLQWDSSLLIYLRRLEQLCQQRELLCHRAALPPGVLKLLDISRAGAVAKAQLGRRAHFFQRAGQRVRRFWQGSLEILSFVGELSLSLFRLFLGRPGFRGLELLRQFAQAGPAALAIISLIGFLMGVILAFIGAIPLQWFGVESYIASLIGIGILRLLAPVMVGVVMAGRTGAAFAAELGSMQINEEIDAYRTLGIDPVRFLVLPRFLALTLMLPFLCLFADLLGLLGGMVVAVGYFNITWLDYYDTLIRTTRLADLWVGLFTSLVFGALVSLCGCFQGINCGRKAESVGKAATDAVVYSIVCIVLATAVITYTSVILGI
ncbi:MAG: ABC transporter permease [Lentisphaeria bacterium]|nr:ABC transporter permease [Lentisphaeria bacterium]MDY0177453.1 ABC transporter permease [Lentisphaeria bacterium]NLZ60077.1 ABC transporter permease [Lentisphaerota bacterium]